MLCKVVSAPAASKRLNGLAESSSVSGKNYRTKDFCVLLGR
jgi:hypothetical protein